jgi:hypothetical protein
MLAGIVFQMGELTKASQIAHFLIHPMIAAITIYVALAGEFLFRFHTKKALRPVPKGDMSHTVDFDKRAKMVVLGLALSTLCIFIR